MKKLFPVAALTIFMSCNNDSKKETEIPATSLPTENTTSTSNTPSSPAVGAASVTYSIGDTVRNISGSVLLQKDKDKLSQGNENLAVVTANAAGGESFVINFLFALKPGIYPVVGLSFSRNNQVFGGILGGKPKLTNYKVNLTQCEDLGSNNLGGHKWKISGSVEEEVTIAAMGIMKMDKTHPSEIKVNKINFANLTFDDNWEEMMNKAMDKMKGNKD